MKNAKEFLEKLQNDEAFSKQVNDGIQAKKAAGAKDYTEALLPVAAELGYEITAEQVEALMNMQTEIISEEELGKAAGGTSCIVVTAAIASLTASAIASATATVTAFRSSSDC